MSSGWWMDDGMNSDYSCFRSLHSWVQGIQAVGERLGLPNSKPNIGVKSLSNSVVTVPSDIIYKTWDTGKDMHTASLFLGCLRICSLY